MALDEKDQNSIHGRRHGVVCSVVFFRGTDGRLRPTYNARTIRVKKVAYVFDSLISLKRSPMTAVD